MDAKILKVVDAIRRKRAMRLDDDDWVTIKGTHVLLGEEGEALSGGKLKGIKFANAKSIKHVSKAVREKTASIKRAVVRVAHEALRFIPNGLNVTVEGETWESRRDLKGFVSRSTGEFVSSEDFALTCELLPKDDIEVSAFENDANPTYEEVVKVLGRMNGVEILDRPRESIEQTIKTAKGELAKFEEKIKRYEEGGITPSDWLTSRVHYYQHIIEQNQHDLDFYDQYEKIHRECAKAIRTAYEATGGSLLKPDSIIGFKRGNEMSEEEADNKNPNPKWKPLSEEPNPSIAYHNNCQTCVAVYEARLRGYNVSAGMWKDEPDNPLYKLSKDYKNAWIDPETGQKPKGMRYQGPNRPDSTLKWIRETMEEGARYTYKVAWKGAMHGHVICASKVNGKVVLYDPQVDETMSDPKEIKAYIKRTRYGFGELLRVDNLMLNTEALNGAFEQSESPIS